MDIEELQNAIDLSRYGIIDYDENSRLLTPSEKRALFAEAARMWLNPNIEAVAEAIYAIDYVHALVAVPKWKSASDGVKGTYRDKAKAAVAAALTLGDTE